MEPQSQPPINDEDEAITPGDFFFTAIAVEGGLAIAAMLLGYLIGPSANALVPRDLFSITWGIGLGFLLALPLATVCQWLQHRDWKAVAELNEWSNETIVPAVKNLTNGEILTICLCSGVGEELLFRGWLQTLFTGGPEEWTLSSVAIGLVVASFVFGCAHFISRLYVVVTMIGGVLFGLMLILSSNLLVPIIAHATFNYIQFIIAIRGATVASSSETTTEAIDDENDHE